MFPELADGIKRFEKEMQQTDEVVHVLLKGHLLIEEVLTRILEQYVFHREHLQEVRLSFFQKAALARSLCLRKNGFGIWELIGAINTARNEIAHKVDSPERERKLTRVRELYLREVADLREDPEAKNRADSVIVYSACALCCGFLASFEGDSRAFRKMVHSMDRGVNKALPEFEL